MRVLLATDGSPSAMVATDLVGSSRWASGTTIDVVAVMDAASVLPPPLSTLPADAQPLEDALERHCRSAVEETAEMLRALGLTVSSAVLIGRPTERLVQRAAETGADLVVCGSRGMGEFKALLLGSVSAGLVDHAPCPVLVARDRRVTRVLLADDGSASALAAERIVARWPLFGRLPVDVLTVAAVHPALRSPFAMLPVGVALAQYDVDVREARERARAVNDGAMLRLEAEGRTVRRLLREGDPASLIIGQAKTSPDDLIVIGSHGYQGLDRLVLGSVSRAVLMHATASVLVVRASTGVVDADVVDAEPEPMEEPTVEPDPTALVAV